MSAEASPSKAFRITVIILRTRMGRVLFLGAVAYFLAMAFPHSQLAAAMNPPLTGDRRTFNDGLAASHYLLPTVKAVELLGGLTLVTGRFVSLAALLLAPILVNALVAYTHRDRCAQLFRAT